MSENDKPVSFRVLLHHRPRQEQSYFCDMCSLAEIFNMNTHEAATHVAEARNTGSSVIFLGEQEAAFTKAKRGNDFKIRKARQCKLFNPGFWFTAEAVNE